jgi:hypothetical protein
MPTAQLVLVIVFVSRVTAPFCASTRPRMLAPLCMLMLVRARTFPTNEVPAKRSAELPICQKTLQASAPPINETDEPTAVVSVLPVLKT